MTTPSLTHAHHEQSYSVGCAGNLIVVNWRARPDQAAVKRIEAVLDAFLEQQPSGVGFLAMTDVDSPAPDGPARDAFASVMKARASRIVGSAMIIEGSGLRSAAARVVVAAITLLGDLRPVPQVCANIDDASTTLARLLQSAGSSMTESEIASAARAVKQLGRH